MKINASVQVSYRHISYVHNKLDKRAIKSTLTLGKSPSPKNELFIIHQSNQFPTGHKYKVKGNIETVFARFVHEGKATIRFKVPEHDLIITSDPVQLKAFLCLLKLGLDGKTPVKDLKLSSLSSTEGLKGLKPIKTKLCIDEKNDYPTLKGFPRTLEILQINKINMEMFDRRILRLQSLRILDLSSNSLKTLPEALGSLPNLTELHLSENKLGSACNWSFVKCSKIQRSLRLLDLQCNEITSLPENVASLKNLVTLKLDNNQLKVLPRGIGNLKQLRNLTASQNKLLYLPGSIRMLQLDNIDVSRNSFYSQPGRLPLFPLSHEVMSLLSIAAKQIVQSRIPYTEETIPGSLVNYLDTRSTFCACGSLSFTSAPSYYVYFNISKISSNITRDTSQSSKYVPVETKFCSYNCSRGVQIVM